MGIILEENYIKLNEMIFNDILQYLIIKKQSFKSLLEISLISKQSFKIIQNLITHQQKQLKITIGSIDSIKKYIENSLDCSNEVYKIKLFQFRDIEYVRCRGSKPKVYKIKSGVELKEFLKENCPQLKRVHLLTFTFADRFEGRDLDHFLFKQLIESHHDYSEGGFFSFDQVESDLCSEYLPLSNRKEFNETHGADKLQISLYNYSLDDVFHYQPRKLSIKYSRFRGLLLYNLDPFLKFDSIESLFIQQPVTAKFIRKALASKSLKSLSVTFMFEKDFDLFIGKVKPEDAIDSDIDTNGDSVIVYEESGDEDEYYSSNKDALIDNIKTKKPKKNPIREETSKRELLVKELTDSLQELSSNSTLKKLEIRILLPFYCRDPTLLFESIKSSGNQTLSKLSIPGYNVTKSNFLAPLLKVPSISTLYFESNPNFKYNVKSFNAYLNHVNENPNISKFKCSLVYHFAACDIILERLVRYFKENTRTLSIFITFQVIMENFFESSSKILTDEFCKKVQQDCLNIQDQLLQQLKQSNNKTLSLIFNP
ncbi:hypothetical protein DICPUDRAFT_79309 [Dictyostelium purpureum]|uniref:Uncharacterized protein n=1 Tax=Dictyostelium purpureum TaxID=5786 RepID=F0ZM72_DICPU|nr:uncharacterized protein DICPUDRAFT_79309 [Dictyostelium purpureum]EGC34944.1 hypothetical protein DICPUDRAFT_79309 [Dictyostelium purpureum]|eukprot:XP_003288525.1 hypothetical protein DICPUDRAFT_79309 [Dictyostelium purpureum]